MIQLFPETEVRGAGHGPVIALGTYKGKPLNVTVQVSQISQNQSLDLEILGSADGDSWLRLAVFPHRFYCGHYQYQLNLQAHPEIAFLRIGYQLKNWAPSRGSTVSSFAVHCEPAAPIAVAAGSR